MINLRRILNELDTLAKQLLQLRQNVLEDARMADGLAWTRSLDRANKLESACSSLLIAARVIRDNFVVYNGPEEGHDLEPV